MIDALVKVRPKEKTKTELGQHGQNLGLWTFHELPRVGETLMLYGAFAEGEVKDEGYTGWKVAEVIHIPRRASIDMPAICIFVDYGANQDVWNRPLGKHHGQGMVRHPDDPKYGSD